MSTPWQIGEPEVARGACETFWCAINGANGKVYHRPLVFCNAHVMHLSDECEKAPAGLVPVGDDGEYEWTGWFERSCDQCETQWGFTGEVLAWMRLPRLSDRMGKGDGVAGSRT